jgi:DNA-binding NarL/FixJ family response regulator
MGGYRAAQELRNLVPNIPKLVVTIHEGVCLVEEAKAVAVRGFVHKREASQTLPDAVYELVLRKGTFFPDFDTEVVPTL